MKILAVFLLVARRFCVVSLPAFADEEGEGLYQHAVVAADHPLASRAGIEILKQGGNVVDAAVATAFVLSVVSPASSGLGGGGFMVIWNADKQQAVALDYRERAPRKATRDMYVDPQSPKNADKNVSRTGHLAIAVPGQVAGLCFALEEFGTSDLKTVMAPAIRLAREGGFVRDRQRKIQSTLLQLFARHPDYRRRFRSLHQLYLNNGKPWRNADRFHSPLRPVLERIAAQGADGFYRGPVAEALIAEIRRGGGIISRDDFSSMKPVVRRPLQGRYRAGEVLTMPPPSSGGVALLEILNILTVYESRHPDQSLEDWQHNSAEYLHLLTEAMKHAFADRAEYLGDADFVNVPVERLISQEYARTLAARIDMGSTQSQESYGRFVMPDDGGTSHFSIIDRRGNAVACTETINTAFGSFVVEPKFGIVLNNEMDDFAAVPGQPNAFGLLQSEANAVAPGKKPLSSMTPTIVVKDGKAVHVAGASGGPLIISATLQVLLNMTRWGMTPEAAVAQPRIHHQWWPDTLAIEPPLFPARRTALEALRHHVRQRDDLAACQAVSRSPEGIRGASDSRKGGQPAGY